MVKQQVELNVTTPGLDEAADKFVRLTAQIRETKRQLQEAQDAGDSVKFNSLKKQLDDLEDKLDVVNLKQKEFHDALATMPGVAGKAGQALQGVETAFKSLIANPIVAILAGIAIAFTTVYEALQKTKAGQDALNTVSDAFGRILTPILNLITTLFVPVLNLLAAGIDKVGKAFASATGKSKEFDQQLADDNAAKLAIKRSETIKKLLDEEGFKFDEITKKKYEATKNYYDKIAVIDKSANTEAEKRRERELARLEQNKAITDADKERKKNAADAEIANLDAVGKLREALLEKRKQEALTTAFTDEQKLAVEIKFEKQSYDLQKSLIEKRQSLYAKGSKDWNDAQAELVALQAGYIGKVRDFADQEKSIRTTNGKAIQDFEIKIQLDSAKALEDQVKARKDYTSKIQDIEISAIKEEDQKAIAARNKKYQEDLAALEKEFYFIQSSEEQKAELRKKLYLAAEQDIQAIKDKKVQKDLQDEAAILAEREKILTKGTLLYYQNARAIEDNAYKQKRLRDKDNAKLLEEDEKEHNKIMLQLDREYANTMLDQTANFFNNLSTIFGKNKELAKIAIRIKEAQTVGSIVMDDLKAIRDSYEASPLTFGLPWSAFYAADMIAGVVSAHETANSAISALDSPSGGSTGISSSGAGQAATPSFNGTVNVPAPVIGGSSASSSGNLGSIVGNAVQAGNSTSRPIQAYVVGTSITTQQQLDRRIALAAKMGG